MTTIAEGSPHTHNLQRKPLKKLFSKLKSVFKKPEEVSITGLRHSIIDVDNIAVNDASQALEKQRQLIAAEEAARAEEERKRREFKKEAYALDHFLHIDDNDDLVGSLFYIVNGVKPPPADVVESSTDGCSLKSRNSTLQETAIEREGEKDDLGALVPFEETIDASQESPKIPEKTRVYPGEDSSNLEAPMPPALGEKSRENGLKRAISRKNTMRLLKFWNREPETMESTFPQALVIGPPKGVHTSSKCSDSTYSAGKSYQKESSFSRFRTMSTKDFGKSFLPLASFGKLKRVASQGLLSSGPRITKIDTRSQGSLTDQRRIVTPTREQNVPKIPLPLENKLADVNESSQSTPLRKRAPQELQRQFTLNRDMPHAIGSKDYKQSTESQEQQEVPVEIFKPNDQTRELMLSSEASNVCLPLDNSPGGQLTPDVIEVDDYNSDISFNSNQFREDDEEDDDDDQTMHEDVPSNKRSTLPEHTAMPDRRPVKKAAPRLVNIGHMYNQLNGRGGKPPVTQVPRQPQQPPRQRKVSPSNAYPVQPQWDSPSPEHHILRKQQFPVAQHPGHQQAHHQQLQQFYNQQYAAHHYNQQPVAAAYTYGSAAGPYGPQAGHYQAFPVAIQKIHQHYQQQHGTGPEAYPPFQQQPHRSHATKYSLPKKVVHQALREFPATQAEVKANNK